MAKPRSTSVLAGCLAAALAGGTADAEPASLSEAQLDTVSAAGDIGLSGFGFDTGAIHESGTRITTQISMPVSNAIAICLFCSGDASAVAIANAIGMGQSNATALSQGSADTFALSNAIGPYLMMFAPPSAVPQPAAAPPAKGGGAGRK